MKDWSFDHHDRLIQDKLPELLNTGVEVLATYLDSRITSLQYLGIPKLKRGVIQDFDEDNEGYLMSVAPVWADVAVLANKFFE